MIGHEQGISDIAWSSCSNYLCSASDDKTVKIWDVATGARLRTLSGHTDYVFCVNFNTQGNLIVSGSFDESIILWDVRAGRIVRRREAHSDPVTSVEFSRDSTIIASASYDGLCRIWDTSNGMCLKTFMDEGTHPVSQVKFSPNSKYLLTANLNGTIKLWDFLSEKTRCLCTYRGHKNSEHCVRATFSATNGARVVSGSEDGSVYLWDLHTEEVVQKLDGHSKDSIVYGVDTHPTENVIVSCSGKPDNTLK